jgi:hypothetical protein
MTPPSTSGATPARPAGRRLARHGRVAAADGTGAADDRGRARRRPAAPCGAGSGRRSASDPCLRPGAAGTRRLRITVRSRRPRRSCHGSDALAGEDIIERAGERGVAVPDEGPEGADPISDAHDQGAGLRSSPCSIRVPGHPGDVRPPGRYLQDDQHGPPREDDRVHGQEVACQQALRRGAQESPPAGIQAARCGQAAAGAADPPDGRRAEAMAGAGQPAARPAVSPGH